MLFQCAQRSLRILAGIYQHECLLRLARSALGGAATKLSHLLPLLRGEFQLTVVPDDAWCSWLDGRERRRLAELRSGVRALNDLPGRLEGWGVAICNADFIDRAGRLEARRRWLRLAWSNEMMWTFSRGAGGARFSAY